VTKPTFVFLAAILWPVAWAMFGAGFALIVSGSRVPHVGVWPQVILCAGVVGITATVNSVAHVAEAMAAVWAALRRLTAWRVEG
jgi:hypothetical protein